MSDHISEDLRRAVKLFNRWQFQEAFDAFTALAAEAEGRDQVFLEGLANLSAGFHRIWHKGGEPNAMVAYCQRGMEMLAPFGKGSMNIQLDGFEERLKLCLDEAMRWRRGDEEIFNRDIIPRLDFKGGDDA
ncbi:MAG: hypothetical protein H6698_06285 [Myxococcales bacterium]|nr:hypothetical protein [Myxococcales bacterium]MCB9532251.1 hypothetical protein [Myxococcales bacterium]MCB9533915.1 hypothetical protein [Myxococcales bacterium]